MSAFASASATTKPVIVSLADDCTELEEELMGDEALEVGDEVLNAIELVDVLTGFELPPPPPQLCNKTTANIHRKFEHNKSFFSRISNCPKNNKYLCSKGRDLSQRPVLFFKDTVALLDNGKGYQRWKFRWAKTLCCYPNASLQ